MKKYILVILILALVIFGLGYGISKITMPKNVDAVKITPTITVPVPIATDITETATPIKIISPDFKETPFQIDGTTIQLVNGLSEVEAAPGSATKITTRYFGNDAIGDLNGDGQPDVAFIVTINTGGSGTFFYVVVTLRSADRYRATNTVLLGDRVAPQTTSIENGILVVNYADRKPDESFAVSPSIAVTKYLKVVNGTLVEENILSQITDREWIWVKTQMNDGSLTTPVKSGSFTITFNQDGTFTGTTDCNNFFGNFKISGNKISLLQIGSTKMACQGSQETAFFAQLNEIDSFMIDNTANALVLLIKYDSGSMIFN